MSTHKICERNIFRDYFQPSRIVLLVTQANNESGVNIATLAFNMHCSYSPPMFAFALQLGSYSLELLKNNEKYTVCIPGENLLEATIFCGENSGRQIDKAKYLDIKICNSNKLKIPTLNNCIAYFELQTDKIIPSGNHELIISEVIAYNIQEDIEKGLLSIGKDLTGYKLLKESGIHRIAIIDC
jgi:flavin reductase (DIM6/NTAB) family NADH-FMN oxidoreductase RutF